ncbi:glucosamine-6-phosphate deaminase [Bacillus horti]|uniref:Glucosamine-6-phosphate deaminase n=1 Tax=Caldalkalibacillus horti TaxID=77523 RepID=A0ABT9VXX4_9BACI|nr:glucosamine-6-phosphate deaminase [Bacillus horti]MDQ0165850.1 glucosamine-6-phosphate deaminase [Bacillus horti]
MQIKVLDHYTELSKQAAHIVIDTISRKEDSVLGLPTGGTPEGMYKELVEQYKNGEISFSQVTAFNLDEYIGIPQNHTQSYYTFMQEKLYSHIDIDSKQTHIPSGEATNLELECSRYEKLIDQAGQLDLLIIGIGTNGHIGFNEPGADIQATTSVVHLAQSTIEANARFFDRIEEVPKQAITMGLGTMINKSKHILLLASGKQKAEIIQQLLTSQEVKSELPASVLHLHQNVTILLDREAASLWERISV